MHLFIKNMVCNRCILAVKALLDKLLIPYQSVQMGEVDMLQSLTDEQSAQLRPELESLGFELLDDSRTQLIEKIKSTVIRHVQQNAGDKRLNFSSLLSSSLHKNYSYLSSLFSDVEGITIEKYVIHQKIEKAKELLVYDELSLGEIADRLGYTSVAHLSAQFKKVTGLTPSHFKTMGSGLRKGLDTV